MSNELDGILPAKAYYAFHEGEEEKPMDYSVLPISEKIRWEKAVKSAYDSLIIPSGFPKEIAEIVESQIAETRKFLIMAVEKAMEGKTGSVCNHFFDMNGLEVAFHFFVNDPKADENFEEKPKKELGFNGSEHVEYDAEEPKPNPEYGPATLDDLRDLRDDFQSYIQQELHPINSKLNECRSKILKESIDTIQDFFENRTADSDIVSRFNINQMTDEQTAKANAAVKMFQAFGHWLKLSLPEQKNKGIALQKLEESFYFYLAAVDKIK